VLYVSGQSLDTTGCAPFKDLKQMLEPAPSSTTRPRSTGISRS